jgi:hypothetical protein
MTSEVNDNYNEGYNDNANPFVDHGQYMQHHEHCHGAGQYREHHQGCQNRDDLEKIQMHILIGNNNAIKFLGCIIFQTGDVPTLLLLSFLVMPLIRGIKYKRISVVPPPSRTSY